MAQENRHLTTEQLSAYLDEQIPASEQGKLEVHIQTCEQCQQELEDLRQTVALLRVMPQPRLPRSFVLPVDTDFFTDVSATHDAIEAPIPLENARARQVAASNVPTTNRSSRWPIYVRSAMRTVSAIAAVLGLVLLLSGLLTAMPHGGASSASSASNASTASQARSTQAPQAEQAYGAASGKSTASTPVAATAQSTTSTGNNENQQSIQGAPTATENNAAPRVKSNEQHTPTDPLSSTSPSILFFDLSVPQARFGFGFLLLLLGCMGFIVFKRRKRLSEQE